MFVRVHEGAKSKLGRRSDPVCVCTFTHSIQQTRLADHFFGKTILTASAPASIRSMPLRLHVASGASCGVGSEGVTSFAGAVIAYGLESRTIQITWRSTPLNCVLGTYTNVP